MELKWRVFLCLAAASLAAGVIQLAGATADRPPAAPGQDIKPRPSLEDMERELLQLLNAERASRGLAPLTPSAPLAAAARGHSLEMAAREVLTHESGSGRTLTDRLAAAGLFFSAEGENVARSYTFSAAEVHDGFMRSPGHRENILNPAFDRVGLSVVRVPGRAFYVTEDFIRSIKYIPPEMVRAAAAGALNARRRREGTPPVRLVGPANRTADALAARKMVGLTRTDLPAFFGRADVHLAAGTDPFDLLGAIGTRVSPGQGRAGIGVRFARTPDFPGGGYFLCAVLIYDDRSSGPDELDRVMAIMDVLDEVRRAAGLPPLALDDGLSRRADREIEEERRVGPKAPDAREKNGVFFFQTYDSGKLDAFLIKSIRDPRVTRIGLASMPRVMSGGAPAKYAVAFVLGR